MENFTFTSRDGLQLAASFQKTEYTPYVVAIVHGMGEHKGRYAHVADFFLHSGYSVALFDQRGHGNSGTGAQVSCRGAVSSGPIVASERRLAPRHGGREGDPGLESCGGVDRRNRRRGRAARGARTGYDGF